MYDMLFQELFIKGLLRTKTAQGFSAPTPLPVRCKRRYHHKVLQKPSKEITAQSGHTKQYTAQGYCAKQKHTAQSDRTHLVHEINTKIPHQLLR